jgi:chromate transporter
MKPGAEARTPFEIFGAFLKLGLTSFGGPIAHLGYFRTEFVSRRRWIDEAGYADLVALCQFLPGPASSQVGFALGLRRGGGLAGGIAAWLGFTLPSALLLFGFALAAARFTGPIAEGLVEGLKLAAVAVVAQAVYGMGRTLTPDRSRLGIALIAMAVTLLLAGAPGQILAILLGALAGLALCRRDAPFEPDRPGYRVSRRRGVAALLLFLALLLLAPLLLAATKDPAIALFDAFYRAGALVFGGGHVVLPLLEAAVVDPGWVGDDAFLAGYGVAQAIPGPLFAFAAYLGAIVDFAPNGATGAVIALVAIFLPGLLLLYGALPFWDALRRQPMAQAAMRGTNAAVVGILGAALYSPLGTGALVTLPHFLLALAGLLLLVFARAPSWLVVLLLAAAGIVLSVA